MSQTPLVLQPLAQLQVAAASALVCAGDLLYLLADDELLLQRYDLNGVFIDQQPLLAGSLPSAAKARKRLSCTGSIPCWATSRPAWRVRTTRLITPNTHSAIWPSSATALIAGLICQQCCPGC